MNAAWKSVAAAAILLSVGKAHATPSTVFWTPATTYTQPFGIPHITYDTYFQQGGAYPIDAGLTIGVLPFEKLQGEIGFDVMAPNTFKKSLLLNAKLTLPDGALAEWSPGLSVGIMNVGFETDYSNYNMLHASLGKTFPFGTLAVGGYFGLNDKLFVDDTGAKARAGFLASYTTPDVSINLTGLNKINFFADVQTGKSAFGAVGAGVGMYFTPAIALLTGPIFFLNSKVQPGQADWMWTIQIDVDVDFAKLAAPAPKA